MKTKGFRLFVFVFVLGLAIFLSTSLGARNVRVPERSLRPARTLPAQDISTTQSSVLLETSPLWARTYGLFYGGPDLSRFEYDMPRAVQPMGEGRFVAAGCASAAYASDSWYYGAVVIEADAWGREIWKVLYPSDPTSQYECEAYAVVRTQNEGCLVVGNFYDPSFPSVFSQVLVMNLGQGGSVRWIKSYRAERSDSDNGRAATATRDGGYAVAAYTDSPEEGSGVWVFKLDDSGNVVWSDLIRISSLHSIAACRETSDGGLIVAGTNFHVPGPPCDDYQHDVWERTWVIKLDGKGGLKWQKSYSLPIPCNTETTAQSMAVTNDGGFVLAGSIYTNWVYRIWVAKFNSTGSIIWQKTYNGGNGSSIIQTSDGGYLVTDGIGAAKALKLSPRGEVQWAKRYWHDLLVTSSLDGAFEKAEGGYVMVSQHGQMIELQSGFEYSPWVLMSIDQNGDIGPGCQYVLSLASDLQPGPVHIIHDSLRVTRLPAQVRTLAYSPYPWPAAMVGHDVCPQASDGALKK